MSGIGRQDSCLEKRVHGFGVSSVSFELVAVDLRVCVLFEINGFLYTLYTGLGVHCFLVLGFELRFFLRFGPHGFDWASNRFLQMGICVSVRVCHSHSVP